MNYLITRCTLWDYAGLAMIEGFITGIKTLDPAAEFACIIFKKDTREWLPDEVKGTNPPPAFTTFFDQPDHMDPAFDWADIAVDIGGLCKGFDVYRAKYQEYCKKRSKPYVFAAQSFHKPDPKIVKGFPAIARGENSLREYEKATGEGIDVGADLYFLVKPIEWTGPPWTHLFTTHLNKPFEDMNEKRRDITKAVQIIWKPDKDGEVFEPSLAAVDKNMVITPAQVLGLAEHAEWIHTARYHMGVAAVYHHIPRTFYVDYRPKYDDLEDLDKLPLSEIKQMAMKSCELAYNEAVKGKK